MAAVQLGKEIKSDEAIVLPGIGCSLGNINAGQALWNNAMNRAHEGNAAQKFCLDLGCTPVMPPNPNRLKQWDYDKEPHKKRNELERLFRRSKGFRRVFTRYDKFDVMFLAFIVFALAVVALNSVNRA